MNCADTGTIEFRIFTSQANDLLDNVTTNGLHNESTSIWYRGRLELWIYDNSNSHEQWLDTISRARQHGYTTLPCERFGTNTYISGYNDWLSNEQTWEKMTARLQQMVDLVGTTDRRVGFDIENYTGDKKEPEYGDIPDIDSWRFLARHFLQLIRDSNIQPAIHPMFAHKIGNMLLAEEFMDAADGRGTFQSEAEFGQISSSLKSVYDFNRHRLKNREAELQVRCRWPNAVFSIVTQDESIRNPAQEVIAELYSPIFRRYWVDDQHKGDFTELGTQSFFNVEHYTAISTLAHAYQPAGYQPLKDGVAGPWDRRGSSSLFIDNVGVTDTQKGSTRGRYGRRYNYSSIETLTPDATGKLVRYVPPAIKTFPYSVVYDTIFDPLHNDWENDKSVINIGWYVASISYQTEPHSRFVFRIKRTDNSMETVEFTVEDSHKKDNRLRHYPQRFGLAVDEHSLTCYWSAVSGFDNEGKPVWDNQNAHLSIPAPAGVLKVENHGIYCGRDSFVNPGSDVNLVKTDRQEPLGLFIYSGLIPRIPNGDYPFFEVF